jgi:hypothetical protein
MPPMTRRSIPAQHRRHPSASKAQIPFHCISLGHSCSQFQFLAAKQSLSYCQREGFMSPSPARRRADTSPVLAAVRIVNSRARAAGDGYQLDEQAEIEDASLASNQCWVSLCLVCHLRALKGLDRDRDNIRREIRPSDFDKHARQLAI